MEEMKIDPAQTLIGERISGLLAEGMSLADGLTLEDMVNLYYERVSDLRSKGMEYLDAHTEAWLIVTENLVEHGQN